MQTPHVAPGPPGADPKKGSSTRDKESSAKGIRTGSSRVDIVGASTDVALPAMNIASTQRFKNMFSPSDMDWMQRYAAVKILGEGAQGRVYKLKHKQTGRLVAAKRMWSSNPKTLARLRREIEALQRLKHPAIVELVEAHVSDDGAAVLIMEFIEGPDFATLIKSALKLPPARAILLASRIASGLAYAASEGVVHRDIKPSNILIAPGDMPKLTDFGLVRIEDDDVKLTAEGQWIGTPQYMAPEQIGSGTTDGRSDMWSLAVTFYESVTGAAPFLAKNPSDLFRVILSQEPDFAPLAKALPKNAELVELVKRCLKKSMEDRPDPNEVASTFAKHAGAQ
jgi:serine/threonine protein kinase